MNTKTKLFIVTAATLLGAGIFTSGEMVYAQTVVINCNSATISGYIGLNGNTSASVWFEWGLTQSLGNSTSHQSFSSDSNFSQLISGLAQNTTYYYRAVASEGSEITTGDIKSFKTFTCPTKNPTVSLTADDSSLSFNGSTILRWSSTNATTCSGSGSNNGWTGSRSLSGSFNTGALTSTRTYNITCSNSSGSASDSVTVNVQPQVISTNTPKPILTSLVLITSSVDRSQPIVPTIDNTRPHPGDEINYTLSYQNIGTGAVTNLTLRIVLPLEVSYMFSNPNNPSISSNTLVFNLGTLRANGQGTVTARVRVRDNALAATNLDFPATLSYVDPSGQSQSVNSNVSAQIWIEPVNMNVEVPLGANIISSGSFLSLNLFGWLLLFIILILTVILLAKYFFQPVREVSTTNIQR